VVAAYEFFHPTVPGALIISGKEAAVSPTGVLAVPRSPGAPRSRSGD
jgi:hypothetical protein